MSFGEGRSAMPERRLGIALTVGAAIGLIAAIVLLVEKIALVENPDYVPSCSINPVLSCGSVMNSPQAAAFGIPNPIIGIAGFAIVGTIGAAILAGGSFRPWFWIAVQSGLTFAAAFVHWLIFQSLYRIGALCPYCMVVWAVTIPLFWHVTVRNLRMLSITRLPRRRSIVAVAEFEGAILTIWFLAVSALIAERFWDYWVTLV